MDNNLNKSEMEVGEIIELPDGLRAMCFSKIGGLKAEVVKIEEPFADVKILATGNIFKIYIG